MSIRFKLFIITIIASSAFFAAVFYNLRNIIIRDYNQLEVDKMRKNVQRIEEVVNSEADNLSTKLSDWAYWDDAYQFMLDHNKIFIKSNLNIESVNSLGINQIIFLDKNNDVFEFSNQDQQDLHVVNEISSYIKNKRIDDKKELKGIFISKSGPLLLAVKPILRSDLSGEPRGRAIFVKRIDNNLVSKFSKLVSLPIEVKSVNHVSDDHSLEVSKNIMSEIPGNFTIYLNGEKIEAIKTFYDLSNNPVFNIETVTNRDILAQGIKSLNYFIITGGVLFLIYLVVFLSLITRLVVDRISRLNASLRQISNSGDLSQRIPFSTNFQKDEINSIIQEINSTLSSLEKVSGEKEWSKRYLDSTIMYWVVLDSTSTILWINNKLANFIGYDKDLLVGHNWSKYSDIDFLSFENNSNFESKLTRSDGNIIIFSWKKSQISISYNNKLETRYVFIGEDITTKKQAEVELVEKNKELEMINKMLVGREVKMAQMKEELDKYKNGQ